MRTRPKPSKIENSYLKLIRRLPLRRIRNEADYDAATRMAERLAIRGEEDLDQGETEYLEALSILIETYDNEHYPLPADNRTPPQRLQSLMQNAGMNVNALGTILGSQSAASMILNGTRGISKSQIMKLAEYFRVDPGFFLPPLS